MKVRIKEVETVINYFADGEECAFDIISKYQKLEEKDGVFYMSLFDYEYWVDVLKTAEYVNRLYSLLPTDLKELYDKLNFTMYTDIEDEMKARKEILECYIFNVSYASEL